MTNVASNILGIRFRRILSRPHWRLLTRVMNSKMALTQPADISAMAIPRADKTGKSVKASDILTTTEIPAKIIGVFVSSRAKKPGMNAFINTKAGRPKP